MSLYNKYNNIKMLFAGISSLRLGLIAVFVIWPLWRLVLAVFMPLTPDEAYYSLWAQHFQLSYYDHPFMVAWWIKAGLMLFGLHVWAMRIAGIIAAFLASWAFYETARVFLPPPEFRQREQQEFPQEILPLIAVIFLNTTFTFGLGMAVITPDTPEMFFIILFFWALSRALSGALPREELGKGLEEEQSRIILFWWVLSGIFLGLAADSKYSFALLLPGLAGFALFFRPLALWRRKGPYYASLAALVVFSPVVIWNAQHHWASFLKQGGRVGDWHPARAVQFLGELLAGQFGLLTPVLFILCCRGVVLLYRDRAERTPCLLLWLIIPCGLFFIFHALGDRVQANWPSVLYPFLVLAAVYGLRYHINIRSLALYTTGCGLLMQVIFSIQALYPIFPLSAHFDPIARQSAGWPELAQSVQAQARKNGADAIIIEDYALASILAVQSFLTVKDPLVNSLPILGTDKRWGFLSSLPHDVPYHPVFLYESRKESQPEREDNLVTRLRSRGWNKTQIVRKYRLTFERAVNSSEARPVSQARTEYFKVTY